MHGLKEGDSNTHSFHLVASTKKKTNTIKHLCNAQGLLTDDEGEIDDIITAYFSNIFMSSSQDPSRFMDFV